MCKSNSKTFKRSEQCRVWWWSKTQEDLYKELLTKHSKGFILDQWIWWTHYFPLSTYSGYFSCFLHVQWTMLVISSKTAARSCGFPDENIIIIISLASRYLKSVNMLRASSNSNC